MPDSATPMATRGYCRNSRLTELISSGRRGETVEYYMTRALCVPAEEVARVRGGGAHAGL